MYKNSYRRDYMSRGIEPTEENVFENEPYRSILNLITRFQDYEKGAISQKHMRYALCKNYDIKTSDNPKGLGKQTILEVKGFFGDKLDEMIKKGEIKTGIITSGGNLNTNYLRRLRKLKISKLN